MAAPTPSSTLVCLSTSVSTSSFCTTPTPINSKPQPPVCNPLPVTSIGCAPGLICGSQPDGSTTCMIRQDVLTTSGLVIAIVFGTIIATMFGTVIFMCCNSRIAASKTKKLQEAAMGNGSEAHLPLMTAQPGATGGEHASMGEYSTLNAPGSGSRSPGHRVPSGNYQAGVGAARVPSRGGGPGIQHTGLTDVNPFNADDEDIAYGASRI